MRDIYRRSTLFVRQRVCLLCAIVCQKLLTTLELRENSGRHDNTMPLCIHVLPVFPASSPCARCIACVVSTQRAINLITGDAF